MDTSKESPTNPNNAGHMCCTRMLINEVDHVSSRMFVSLIRACMSSYSDVLLNCCMQVLINQVELAHGRILVANIKAPMSPYSDGMF